MEYDVQKVMVTNERLTGKVNELQEETSRQRETIRSYKRTLARQRETIGVLRFRLLSGDREAAGNQLRYVVSRTSWHDECATFRQIVMRIPHHTQEAGSALEPQSSDLPPDRADGTPARILLRVEEAAKEYGVSRALMYQILARPDAPPVVRLGRSVRVPADALKAWAEARQEPWGGSAADG